MKHFLFTRIEYLFKPFKLYFPWKHQYAQTKGIYSLTDAELISKAVRLFTTQPAEGKGQLQKHRLQKKK